MNDNENKSPNAKENSGTDSRIISELRSAYKMIEKSRKSPEHRKVKHAVEQNMLLENLDTKNGLR